MKSSNRDIEVALRRASPSDCNMLLEWRNLPEIIAFGKSQRPVTKSRHDKWFASALSSPFKLLLIIHHKNIPIGQVRFELLSEVAAAISIFVLPNFSGKGIGTVAIAQGCEVAFSAFPKICRIEALILHNNIRSLRAFEKAGFELQHKRSNTSTYLRLIRSK